MTAFGKRPPVPVGGLPRCESTFLMRLRTSNAHTAQWITNHTSELDPSCPHCGVTQDILHGLVHWPSHADVQRRHLLQLVCSSETSTDGLQVLHPTGSKQLRRSLRNRLLRFLRDSGWPLDGYAIMFLRLCCRWPLAAHPHSIYIPSSPFYHTTLSYHLTLSLSPSIPFPLPSQVTRLMFSATGNHTVLRLRFSHTHTHTHKQTSFSFTSQTFVFSEIE